MGVKDFFNSIIGVKPTHLMITSNGQFLLMVRIFMVPIPAVTREDGNS